MKKINIQEYDSSMGKLIDVQDSYSYQEFHHPASINVPSDKLLLNHKKYLNMNDTYYIVCKKGFKSHNVVSILEFYGYKVVSVSYE